MPPYWCKWPPPWLVSSNCLSTSSHSVAVYRTPLGEDLSGLSVSLVDLLCQNFDSGEGSHLVAHPCAHWVVRKLLEGEGGGEDKYPRSFNPSLNIDGCVAQTVLLSCYWIHYQPIRFKHGWGQTEEPLLYAGMSSCDATVCTSGHVVFSSSLLRSKLPGVQERVSQMVQPIMSSLRTDPSKGQQALLSELDRASPSGGHLI